MAALAAHTHEALLQPAALQVGLELFLHVVRQRPAGLGAQLTECGIVLLDELIVQRAFRSMPGVAGRTDEWRRTRAATDMAGVPAAGWDGRGYGATTSDGLGKSTAFDQKRRA